MLLGNSTSGARRTLSTPGFLTTRAPDVWSHLADRCRVSRATAKRLGYRVMWLVPAADLLQCWIAHHMTKLDLET